jgi:predicted PurR-regulated permease PerM
LARLIRSVGPSANAYDGVGRNPEGQEVEMDGPGGAGGLTGQDGRRLRLVLERRAEWVEALIILATVAAAFVVLDFLSRYFQDYFRLILIFFFAWLLAFLISPVADWLQRHLTRLPRGLAVIAVIVPVILIGALILVRVMVALAESLAQLAAALPDLIANPPPILADIQGRLDDIGIHVDVVASFQTIATDLFKGLADIGVGLFGGVLSAFGTVVDAIIVVSLAVFMAIDRDKILRLGLEITAPDKREDALLFRRSVATAAAGFIRSQLVLGGLYGVWAWIVSLAFGLPFAPATAVLSGLIMAIPIYGPYVSWLPPVAIALLVQPDLALLVAIVMLIGWFIDENILAPVVRAGALDLNPIVVTFAFLLGAQLAGAIGAIVAIPLAAVVQAFVVKYFEQYRTKRGWPDPDARPEAGSMQPGAPPIEPDASG